MNRKLLVGVLIALAVSNVFGTLLAIGVLSPTASPPNSANMITLTATTAITVAVSTKVMPETLHHHYTEDLSVSVGGCANPSVTVC